MSLEDDIKQGKFHSEYNKIVVNLMYTSSWLHEQQGGIFKRYNLTGPQYNVLRILRGQKGKPATINLIIERMLDRMSNASRIVDKLEEKKLVARKQCANDRRAVDVVITKDGMDLLAEMDDHMKAWESSLKVISKEEANMLNNLLDKLRTATK